MKNYENLGPITERDLDIAQRVFIETVYRVGRTSKETDMPPGMIMATLVVDPDLRENHRKLLEANPPEGLFAMFIEETQKQLDKKFAALFEEEFGAPDYGSPVVN